MDETITSILARLGTAENENRELKQQIDRLTDEFNIMRQKIIDSEHEILRLKGEVQSLKDARHITQRHQNVTPSQPKPDTRPQSQTRAQMEDVPLQQELDTNRLLVNARSVGNEIAIVIKVLREKYFQLLGYYLKVIQ